LVRGDGLKLVLAGGLFVAAILIVAGCFGIIGDCFGYGELESGSYAGAASAVLDSAHPIAEQQITIRLSAAALPADIATKATFEVAPDTNVQPVPSIDPGQTFTTPPSLVPEVTIIRADTNTVVPATVAWASRTGSFRPVFASIPIDCPAAKPCERAYRVRVSAPSLREGEQVSVSWIAQAKLVWTGSSGPCGRPEGATAKLEQTPPRLVAASESAFAAGIAQENGGNLIARHVTVTSDGSAASSASMRISTAQRATGPSTERNPEWRQWVRVLPDNVNAPVGEALVGDEPYTSAVLRGGTLDVPILGDCPAGVPCRRGYWVVFQNFRPVEPWPGEPDRSLDVGGFAWSAAATATSAEGSTGPPVLTLQIDDLDSGLPAHPTVAQSAPPITLPTNKVPTALDVTITVPVRPQPENGLDPLAASVAIVNVTGSGVALVAEVRGDGAGPIVGAFNGDGRSNLIAHPFGACPDTGSCTATLQLVGTFHVESSGSQAESASLAWAVQLLGAPAGTTVAFGTPHQLPVAQRLSAGPVIVGALALMLVVLAAVWWRRRRARSG
jgi:hypothetical protein